MFMAKRPLSVTLDAANLVWLRGRAAATGRRSVSELLDAIVTDARLGGRQPDVPSRSVAGTIDIAADDPDLDGADALIATLFSRSLSRPFLAREASPTYQAGTVKTPRRKSRG
jgi:hypothetical protein